MTIKMAISNVYTDSEIF